MVFTNPIDAARSLAVAAFLLCSAMLSGRGMPFVDAGRQVVNVNTDQLTRATLTVVTFNMLHGYGSRLNDSTLGLSELRTIRSMEPPLARPVPGGRL
ncbi:MAG: hypothetical protein NT005_01015 [Spirochaetes bacterium]|nr:hypothetical protein [Spirochaetota bacterium]